MVSACMVSCQCMVVALLGRDGACEKRILRRNFEYETFEFEHVCMGALLVHVLGGLSASTVGAGMQYNTIHNNSCTRKLVEVHRAA